MDLESLKTRVGPLPIWLWGLLLGGAVVAYMYVRQSQTNTAAAATGTGSTSALNALGAANPQDPLTSSGNYGMMGATSTTGTPTNQSWQAAGIANANTWGISDIGMQSALQNYLAGMPLNSAEQNAVNKVLGTVGPPPEGVSGLVNGGTSILNPPTPVQTTTAPKATGTPKAAPKPVTKTAAPKPVNYTARWGDTLSGIAASNHTTVSNLMKLNPQIHNANLIYAGHTYRVK